MEFYPLFPIIHKILKPVFPGCLWEGNVDESKINSKVIALSVDDGPHPENTPELLQVLEEYKIPASFFWLGCRVNRYPEIAQAVVSSNKHWIALHGYEHHNFPFLSANQLKESLEKTQIAIHNACGLTPQQIRDVRPPNGLFTPQTLKLFREWNYRPVMWSVVPEDWVKPGINTVVKRVMKSVKNGSLIVLHDGVCGGEDVSAIARILIPMLLEEGYNFVTVDDFWKTNLEGKFGNQIKSPVSKKPSF